MIGEEAPLVDVVIEIPRGSFIKRDSSGNVDFISPFPTPFNYGSIPAVMAADGDYLDAVVLGPRLEPGTTLTIPVLGVVGMIDEGVYEDKLICSYAPITPVKKSLILLFFRFYAKAKVLINWIRGRKGGNRCLGWRTLSNVFPIDIR